MAKTRSVRPKERRLSGEYLQAWLNHLGLRQADLAARLGVTNPTVSKWCANRAGLKPNTVIAIAEALGIRDVDLFRWPGDVDNSVIEEERLIARLRELDPERRAHALRILDATLDFNHKDD